LEGGEEIKIKSGMNPHLTLTLSPPIGWEGRGNSRRTRTVLSKSAERRPIQGIKIKIKIKIKIRIKSKSRFRW
jgi:hypothetical protein